MQVLKLKLYQQFANYRKPLSYNFVDTFPLPTYSHIKGWIHKILQAGDYIPISISIQGFYESVVYDLQTFYKFDRIRKEKEGIILSEYNKSLIKSPFYVANLYNVSLILHINMAYEYLKKIETMVFDTFPAIGRYEDIARIDEINFVDIEKKETGLDFYKIRNPIYLKQETADRYKLIGINFRIPFKYTIKNDLRYFEKIDTVYVEEGTLFGEIIIDSEGDLVELVGDYNGED
ncbi:MAG TPA: type I-B CRISPR-associated protein Cas5b [Dictyoglomaceae bacterium]|nr:type I-B CRISPR-associated protein Cas5b [Dictyoglomaceae bacterium]HOL39970.1 type I-B CRISPR-associated protein Cas5b [Dictyoglomaceae bacterium]HPP16446.1 type I-B CRISPR-associated protein Cas5b [Dictyoglomaceae bacterium]HPU44180.1 type I-B CRISPR-associated protein Cas5b [Dictyoglomaceae bacterium]